MHAVSRIEFSGTVATGVECISRTSDETGSVKARKEVILAADIDVLVDLPVGYNLQDHPTLYFIWNCSRTQEPLEFGQANSTTTDANDAPPLVPATHTSSTVDAVAEKASCGFDQGDL
ncbi:uncharacterized protein BKCO1_6300027 [Diplodia corticola]|uniref:Uncharacterized protein n=1 Tax=Diplodia corticola TaxID=236234 RepID=A0A1J9RQU1_9PEZI|nr:uncharacterized protein BKCO1_6300027 [Diplodia corticola]OJD30268.1 hypothetical protein BKCO1_6300027 [Diplodia corticola]